jgi:hypothetical protein
MLENILFSFLPKESQNPLAVISLPLFGSHLEGTTDLLSVPIFDYSGHFICMESYNI